MKRDQSSTTAQGIAAIRALESSKPPSERICYDPYARQLTNRGFYLLSKLFAGYGEKRAPGVSGYLVARTRYIDDYLQACIDADIAQLVILGAGLDSRAYRFDALKERVKVFEADHPATQSGKLEKIKQIFGELPKHVTYVPIDFNIETLQKLCDVGYDRQLQTLFIWEGVTYYLTAEAVDKTLEFVRKNSGRGSRIIFDYVFASALTAAHKRAEITRMQRYRRFTGEALTFGIDQAEEFLGQRGFTQIKNATCEDFRRAYFSGVNQHRPIAPIYAIVYAATG